MCQRHINGGGLLSWALVAGGAVKGMVGDHELCIGSLAATRAGAIVAALLL